MAAVEMLIVTLLLCLVAWPVRSACGRQGTLWIITSAEAEVGMALVGLKIFPNRYHRWPRQHPRNDHCRDSSSCVLGSLATAYLEITHSRRWLSDLLLAIFCPYCHAVRAALWAVRT